MKKTVSFFIYFMFIQLLLVSLAVIVTEFYFNYKLAITLTSKAHYWGNSLHLNIIFYIALLVAITFFIAYRVSVRLKNQTKILAKSLNANQDYKNKIIIKEFLDLYENVKKVNSQSNDGQLLFSSIISSLDIASEQLLEYAKKANTNFDSVEDLVNEIQSGVAVQSANSINIAHLMKEIATSSQEAANSVSKAENISIQSAQAAEYGQDAIKNV
jgi:methyl-accepting chemotaxis protein